MFRQFLVVCSFLVTLQLFAQDSYEDYVIDFITTKSGLSHNYVSSLVSDDLNMKWIGTENGITKFNGYDFDYIKPNKQYKGLLNENIEVLFIDKNSDLWIGTKSGGLSFLDIKKNKITDYNYLIDTANEGDLRITALSQDAKGNIWIGTWKDGVFVIDVENDILIDHLNYYQPVYNITKDFKNNMWFCNGLKLHMFDTETLKIASFPFKFSITNILSDSSRNKIWIASSGDDTNLYIYDYLSKKIDSIETGVSSGFSKILSLDKNNRIWIGTWRKGVYRSNLDVSKFHKIELVPDDSKRLKGNYTTILSIHHDKNNVTWLSTAGGGVVKILKGNGFKNIDQKISKTAFKEYLNCTSIYKSDKKIFLGTLLKGVYYGDDFSNLKQIKEVGDVKINTLYQDENSLYIGTAEGFAIFDLRTEKITFSTSKIKKATSLLVDGNQLFIGTQQNGLAIVPLNKIENLDAYIFYDESLKKNKLESNRVTTIVKDSSNDIWVSTYNGIHLYDRESKEFIHQRKFLKEKLPSVIINSMAIRDGKIWLATPNGLIKLNTRRDDIKIEEILTKKDGLNSDFICSVTFDNQSNLWFSTHTEVVKYDYIKKAILSYGDINGVKSTSFNNNSFYNFKGETIFFGGIDNVTYFNPQEIKDYEIIPELIFTNLRVNNQIIRYQEGDAMLSKNFNYADAINLTYEQNFFSTRFVVNDFLGNLNLKYRYKLEGYQDQWIDLQNRNEINFAGLSAGNYKLAVTSSRDSQNWSKPKYLTIKLSGSPWKSGWAISIYILIITLIIVYLVRVNNARIKFKNDLEIANIDKQKEIELTEAKLNFFTNISHEFRTPLTLIVSPLKELLESDNLPPKVYKSLNYIDKNTNRLLNLINQLLDFRKADHGLLTLDVSNGNFVRFSNEVFLYFKQSAKSKNIRYNFKSSKEIIQFPFDRNKMEIVLCNIISNALKYTDEGNRIRIKVDSDDEFCIISVKDTGIGMREADLDKIFDRFFQIKSANTAKMIGSGIGLSFSKKIVELHYGSILVTSKLNEGTEFIIKLAMNPSLYKGFINQNFMTTDNISGYTKNITSEDFDINTLKIETKKNTLLIIDDNPEILSYLKDVFSQDYNVIEAEDGNVGFKKASAEIPDLIISDVMMPEKDGITMCKELKSQITTSHIPIILLTARTSTVFEIEGLKTGANDYVTKPFAVKVIKARVESLLENRDRLRTHLLNKVRFEPTAEDVELDTDIENVFITKAILLVEKNLENSSFGIETMVDELHMSRSSLFRKIKSLTGLSLSAFIRSIRLKKAAHLILTSDLNLSQISFEVGFNDYKYFKTSFKKQFKCLPSKYSGLYQQ
ncbi:MAG: signal transduction histidine kinase/DNA-binding response OmpR family regulator [Arenicella sp.]|jgi:signal transduction histidine kinase/DNA-binding response OmpR family regulator/ligand-binding sensor domain-containing protein